MNVKLFGYAVARSLGIFALCRRLTRTQIRILGYHGASLGDEGSFNPLLFISPGTFGRRIAWLQAKGFHVIGLDEAVDAIEGTRHAPTLATVITFDDGWYSTAKVLVPILVGKGMPSAIYLHSGQLERGWPVLPVAVNYLLWKYGGPTIEIDDLGPGMDGLYNLDGRPARNAFVQRSCDWLEAAGPGCEGVAARLHQLANVFGIAENELGLQSRRFHYMSRDELREVAAQRCTVELHGHEHRYPVGDPEAFSTDLQSCRRTILDLGLREPRHYCYPSGAFDAGARAVLDRMGVRSGTTCKPGLIRPRRDASRRHYLPRFLDGDNIAMLVFEAEMSGFADLLRRLARR